jgi:hypothetical protein
MANCLYSLVFPIHGLKELESVVEDDASYTNLSELSIQLIQKNVIIFGENSL